MKIFNLPDLGEGLTEAEVHEWHVKEGDTVKADQLMVSMETAKAVVEVPAPREGTIAKLYGKVGDIIRTDAPLVEFTDGDEADAGSVVGNMSGEETTVLSESATGITPTKRNNSRKKVLPALRALAKRLNVDINAVTGSGPEGKITKEDIEAAASGSPATAGKTVSTRSYFSDGEPLRGVRRIMSQAMRESFDSVCAVTICDDADLHAWSDGNDITARVIRALCAACQAEPSLNSWFDGASESRKVFNTVNLGLALDSKDGLFVPVITDAQSQSRDDLRATINRFKEQVADRSIDQKELQGASITLSNFGSFAGRYANPVVVPPTVSIIGTGRIRHEAIALDSGKIESHRVMPLSVTFDHRSVTGGEATRFLAAMISDLQQAE